MGLARWGCGPRCLGCRVQGLGFRRMGGHVCEGGCSEGVAALSAERVTLRGLRGSLRESL